MARMWVPPKVERRLVEERNAYTASVESMVDRFRGVMNELNPRLKEIDPHLELIFAPPNVTAPGLVPGRYHVMRHNPGAPPSLMPLEGPDGEFIEPGSRLLDELRSRDMWSPEAVNDRRLEREARERRQAAEKARQDELRRDELRERWAAASRAFVSMNMDAPWTQNASANARRYAGEQRRKRAA